MSMNVYPASVTIGQTVLQRVRVRTSDAHHERLQVWQDRDHVAVLVLDAVVAQVPKDYNMWAPMHERNAQLILDNPAGTVVIVQAEGGCGCGSPLRNLPSWGAMQANGIAVDLVGVA